VISFSWAEDVPGGQIHQRMCAHYGNNTLSRRVVYEWIEMFKNGHTSVTDAEGSGHPTTATAAQNEEGPILETCLERGTTVTSATYCHMLQGGLKPAIRSK
jgi:transposase